MAAIMATTIECLPLLLHMCTHVLLKTTPDFNRLPCLETLDLSYCSSLEEVHISIGILASLVHLNLRSCRKLRSLPDSICSLRALEVLTITGCTSLKALPTELGSIGSLKTLEAFDLSVSKLPDSIGRLSNLVNLYFAGSKNLVSLPYSICVCEKLEKLPVQTVCADCTSFNRFLDLSSLKHLMKLDLRNCFALKEIQGLEEVTSLEYLNLSDCRSMERLPNLSNLKHLRRLDLRNCASLTEFIGLEEVTSLEDLQFCNQEWINAQDCTSLEDLTLSSCRSLKRIPNLSNFKRLRRLNLSNCSGLTKIQGLEELNSLKFLHMAGCNSSFLAYTLTKRFFQILSRFGHEVEIIIGREELRAMTSLSSEFEFVCYFYLHLGIQLELGSRMSLDLQPHASRNFLAIILAFEDRVGEEYSVKNITTGFIWSGTLCNFTNSESLIVIVPSSILSIGDGDNRIELKSNQNIGCWIHLLYKTEITMISEYCSANNVEDERSNHLPLFGNTVNVREQISNALPSDLESNKMWFSWQQ